MDATMMQFIYETVSPSIQIAAGILSGFLVIMLILMALLAVLSNKPNPY